MELIFSFIGIYIFFSKTTEAEKKKLLNTGLIIGALGGLLQMAVVPIFEETPSVVTLHSNCIFIITITLTGLLLASRMNLPLLWNDAWQERRVFSSLIGVSIGIGLGLINLFAFSLSPKTLNSAFVQITQKIMTSPKLLLLTPLQAGLVEEVLFRLFLVSGFYWFFETLKPKWLPLTIAIITSSLLFGLPETHHLLMATFMGILLSATYLKLGLIPVILAHAVGDYTFFLAIKFFYAGLSSALRL